MRKLWQRCPICRDPDCTAEAACINQLELPLPAPVSTPISELIARSPNVVELSKFRGRDGR